MTRDGVRAAAVEAPRPQSTEAGEADHFSKMGLVVHYDDDGRVEAIGLTRNARVTYDGYDLFGHPALEVRSWARARHPDLDESEGFTSTMLGISMSAPLIDEADLTTEERADPAQSFLVFGPGYYERGLERAASRLEAKGESRAAEILRGKLRRLRG